MKKQISFAIFSGIAALLCLLLLFPFPKENTPPASSAASSVQSTPVVTSTPAPTTTEPLPTPAPDAIRASHAFAFDALTSDIYYIKGNMHEKVAPASLTKLFTALVVLEILDKDTVVKVGEEVTWISPNSSIAYLGKGQKLTVDMLIEGMLLQSGNDAAYTLAVAAGRALSNNSKLSAKGALKAYMEHMNKRAQDFGLTGTQFINPDGIDAKGHYTTIADLMTIAQLSLQNDTIAQYAGMAKDNVRFVSGQTASWKNTNELLQKSSKYYCEQAIGLKTGSTTDAGKCLISAFRTDDGDILVVGVLGCKNDKIRYQDTLLLYNLYK